MVLAINNAYKDVLLYEAQTEEVDLFVKMFMDFLNGICKTFSFFSDFVLNAFLHGNTFFTA